MPDFVIIGRGKKPGMGKEDGGVDMGGEMSSKEEAAGLVRDALKSGDNKKLAVALEEFIAQCSSGESEGESEGEDSGKGPW